MAILYKRRGELSRTDGDLALGGVLTLYLFTPLLLFCRRIGFTPHFHRVKETAHLQSLVNYRKINQLSGLFTNQWGTAVDHSGNHGAVCDCICVGGNGRYGSYSSIQLLCHNVYKLTKITDNWLDAIVQNLVINLFIKMNQYIAHTGRVWHPSG